MMVEGKLKVEGQVIHVLVQKAYNITSMLMSVTLVQPLKPVTIYLPSPAPMKSPAASLRSRGY
jgi:hypothetical protein